MSPFGNPSALGFLPVTAIEEASRFEARPVYAVETERVDCDAVKLGARHIERVHPAMRAKCVLGHTRTEWIGGQRVLAARSNSKFSGATGRWRMPFFVQTVQLHCDSWSRSTWARKRTRPQWQPPSRFSNTATPIQRTLNLTAPEDGASSNRSRPHKIARRDRASLH